jgi:hypothetical protein
MTIILNKFINNFYLIYKFKIYLLIINILYIFIINKKINLVELDSMLLIKFKIILINYYIFIVNLSIKI